MVWWVMNDRGSTAHQSEGLQRMLTPKAKELSLMVEVVVSLVGLAETKAGRPLVLYQLVLVSAE